MKLAAVLTLALALFAWMQAVAAPTAQDRLEALFRAYLEEEFKHSPLFASRLGDRRFDDRFDLITDETIQQGLVRTRDWLARLPKEVAKDQLDRASQIDFEIFEHHLRRSIWLMENRPVHELDPCWYLEMVTEGAYGLLIQSSRPRAENVRNVAARMRFMPTALQTGMKLLKRPPLVYTETAIKRTRGAIAFFESGIYELAEETPATSPLKEAAPPLLTALRQYLEFLEKTLLPRSDGEWRLGADRFAAKLELELEAGVAAAEVYAQAKAEAERVENEMYVIARQLWHRRFPGQVLPPDTPPGRRQTIHAVLSDLGREHGEPNQLLADTIATVADIKEFIAQQDILRLPDPDQCQIIEMPEFSVAYLNPAPPLDPAVRSFYAISPPPREWDDRRRLSYLEEYNRHMLKILTIHEAYPGHYVQLAYSNRHPSLIRRILTSGVFAEGWAVYTEQMMLDQGFGAGDLALRMHQLKFYLRAVVNALLDHEMHCRELSDDEAMKLLMQRAFQSEGEAAGKVIRAKLSSCQLSTYFVGRMAFYRLRQDVQTEQGPEFHLGRYHEAVLDHGTLPVKYLPELVRARLRHPR
ncbi:MAG TPA: DUF885 domain-containing protein [Gemmatales bacterium]|nr:DUF885 domain-containing protein [Gemmatales bacterium]